MAFSHFHGYAVNNPGLVILLGFSPVGGSYRASVVAAANDLDNSELITVSNSSKTASATVQELIDFYTTNPAIDEAARPKESTVKAVIVFWKNVDHFNAVIPMNTSYASIRDWVLAFVAKETSNATNSNLIRYASAFKSRALTESNNKLDSQIAQLQDKKNEAGANTEAIDKTIQQLESYKDSSSIFEDTEKMDALLDVIEKSKEQIKDPSIDPYKDANSDAAEKFKTDNAEMLAKKVEEVTLADKEKIEKIAKDYEALSEEAKKKLTNGEAEQVQALKQKLAQLEEAENKANQEAEKFKTDNAEMLAKKVEEVTLADKEKIEKIAKDYDALSEEAKKKLTNGEAEQVQALKQKLAQLEEAENKANQDAEKFKTDNAEMLAKKVEEVTLADKEKIEKIAKDYDALSEEAKKKLTNGEAKKVQELKKKLAELEAAASNVSKEVEKFRQENREILNKEVSKVNSNDRDKINKALENYKGLSDKAKEKLAGEKEKLDKMKAKLDKAGVQKTKTVKKVKGTKASSPKTSDTSNLYLYIVLMAMSMAFPSAVSLRKRLLKR